MEGFTDVLIIDSGVAGLFCALQFPLNTNICIATKLDLEDCNSNLAQGGISALKDPGDYTSYYEDTLRAGHYENNSDAVHAMIQDSPSIIDDLRNAGIRLDQNIEGVPDYTCEGERIHDPEYSITAMRPDKKSFLPLLLSPGSERASLYGGLSSQVQHLL